MTRLLQRLWNDGRGAVMSAEMMLLVTLLAVGIIVGAKAFRDSALTEMADFAQAIANLDQSYNIPDATDPDGTGSGFVDARDYCDTETDINSTELSTNSLYQDPPESFVRYGTIAPGESRLDQAQ